jgi:hypothetical protein
LLTLYPDNLDQTVSPSLAGQPATVRDELIDFASHNGYPVLDLSAAIGDVRDQRARVMRLREDPHPSPAGHRAIAQALFEELSSNGLLSPSR